MWDCLLNIYRVLVLILLLVILGFIKKYLPKKVDHFKNINILSIPKVDRPSNWSKLPFLEKLRHYGMNLTTSHTMYADKLKVKELLSKMNIPDLNIAKVIKVYQDNEKLNLKELPNNCIIKSNNGWNDLIIIKQGQIKKMITKGKKLEPQIENYEKWKSSAVLPKMEKFQFHYKLIKPIIFAEEYLGDNLNDFKFFCFDNQMKLLQVNADNFEGSKKNLYDDNFNLLKIKFGNFSSNPQYILDKRNMKKISKIINKIGLFEFARIDFYLINNKIYFGEYTFTPKGCTTSFNPKSFDVKMGNYWK